MSSNKLLTDIQNISQKLASKSFSIAVLGEFSQGKSTFLNALVGEKIQPTRAIPCSSTISVLKHGIKKRVLCYESDCEPVEVPLNQYKELAALPKEVATGGRISETFAQNTIKKLVFEHPNLELCQHGVELLDSPGLNEHPRRTDITKELLKETDAAIFIANASRPLTQTEQELLQDIRTQLTGGNSEPAQNLFVVVNFMDMLEEEDREDVKQRFHQFLLGTQKAIIHGENQVHYISAKRALEATLNGEDNEYAKAFHQFTETLQNFLVFERGKLQNQKFVSTLQSLVQTVLQELQKSEHILSGEIVLSQGEVEKILEQIGDASGREVKFRILYDELLDQVIEEANESWKYWIDGLADRLSAKVEQWSSEHSAIWSQDQLVADYAEQFNRDLYEEVNDWIENELKQNILQETLTYFDEKVQENLKQIQVGVQEINLSKNPKTPNWIFHSNSQTDLDDASFWGGLGLTGLGVAVFVPAIILGGPIVAVLGGLVAGGLGGTGIGGMLGIDSNIRHKVFDQGCEQFASSLDKMLNNINEIIINAFVARLELIDEFVSRAISAYENLLQQQEKVHQHTVEQRQTQQAWIEEQCHDLESLRKLLTSTSVF